MNSLIGSIKVLDIIDNPDGSANVTFEISDEFKINFMNAVGWNEWSDEKFNVWVVESLTRHVSELEGKDND